MAKFTVGNLLEVAKPCWVIDADGNILGTLTHPVRIEGTVSLAATEDSSQILTTDDIGSALVTIDFPHHEVHEGSFFTTSYYFGSVANNATFIMLLLTGAKYDHIVWGIACGGDCEVEIVAEPVVTNVGTSIAVYNMNRGSLNAPLTAAWHTPTIAGGVTLEHFLIPGGSGPQSPGGIARAGAEWIIKPNTYYAVRGTNRSGNSQLASIVMQWYGETGNG